MHNGLHAVSDDRHGDRSLPGTHMPYPIHIGPDPWDQEQPLREFLSGSVATNSSLEKCNMYGNTVVPVHLVKFTGIR